MTKPRNNRPPTTAEDFNKLHSLGSHAPNGVAPERFRETHVADPSATAGVYDSRIRTGASRRFAGSRGNDADEHAGRNDLGEKVSRRVQLARIHALKSRLSGQPAVDAEGLTIGDVEGIIFNPRECTPGMAFALLVSLVRDAGLGGSPQANHILGPSRTGKPDAEERRRRDLRAELLAYATDALGVPQRVLAEVLQASPTTIGKAVAHGRDIATAGTGELAARLRATEPPPPPPPVVLELTVEQLHRINSERHRARIGFPSNG